MFGMYVGLNRQEIMELEGWSDADLADWDDWENELADEEESLDDFLGALKESEEAQCRISTE